MREPASVIDSKQRVRLTIGHQATDRAPKGEILIEDAVVAQVLGCPAVGFAERLMFCRQLGQDLICLQPEYGSSDHALPAPETVEWPDLREWIDQSGLFTFAMLDGVIGWGTKIYGYTECLMLPKKSPVQFAELVSSVARLNSALAAQLIDMGIDGLLLADDLGYQRGLLFRREMIREQILPALASTIAVARQARIPVFMHSDGNLTEIMPDIVEMGFNGFHCLDKNSGMDPSDLQRLYGRELCLWGGLAVEDLAQSEDDRSRSALVSELHNLQAKGGFILGTNSGLFAGINIESLTEIQKLL